MVPWAAEDHKNTWYKSEQHIEIRVPYIEQKFHPMLLC